MEIAVLLSLTIVGLIFMFGVVMIIMHETYKARLAAKDFKIQQLEEDNTDLRMYLEVTEDFNDQIFFDWFEDRMN